MAWRWGISRCFYPRNLVLKQDHSACNLILSVDHGRLTPVALPCRYLARYVDHKGVYRIGAIDVRHDDEPRLASAKPEANHMLAALLTYAAARPSVPVPELFHGKFRGKEKTGGERAR